MSVLLHITPFQAFEQIITCMRRAHKDNMKKDQKEQIWIQQLSKKILHIKLKGPKNVQTHNESKYWNCMPLSMLLYGTVLRCWASWVHKFKEKLNAGNGEETEDQTQNKQRIKQAEKSRSTNNGNQEQAKANSREITLTEHRETQRRR